ncbi:succinylglutamate desuccinylase/aspartoacylase family protein [Belnapia sp. F-4-1]|uniref:succinylglutamate desuccinylase/aspartoacylase domain-containing protein n=1 Tax=Belnapia sp. F-4-1 TaxID=1545443 RepID=UPI0005BA23F4|nr:succinylglutamate desuccinylase/aspartoacylase family protein [Belnapia sp. F-4-1]
MPRTSPPVQGGSGLLRLEVQIAAPDLRPFLGGNALPGVWSFAAEAPGPHVAVVALMHGNEIAGAVVLDRWLRAGLRPVRGRLSLVFANVDAYARFDPADPTASRFLDEDMNRLWDEETLEGGRRSTELRRARVLRPFFDDVDILFDLHSMLWPSDPLMLVGRSARAAELALGLGVPPLVVSDQGHASGRRLIDYGPLSRRAAILVEAGSHWETATIATMEASGAALLRASGVVAPEHPVLAPPAAPAKPRLAEVTRTVAARTSAFAFVQAFRGGEVVKRRNTLIALDGEAEIRSPHDDCLLVMPSLRTMPGQTAVRLARFVG